MLQSSQVKEEEILQAIIREYLIDIYHFALVVLEDDNLAFNAACDTIALAVNNRHRYLGGQSGRIWLYTLAWQVIWRANIKRKWKDAFTWRKKASRDKRLPGLAGHPSPSDLVSVARLLQALTLTRKIGLYLSVGMGFSTEEISSITGHKTLFVQKELDSILNRLGAALDGNLSAVLQTIWPLPSFDLEEIKEANDLIGEAVFLQKKRGSSSRSIKMVGLGGAILVPILLLLSFSTRFSPVEKHQTRTPGMSAMSTTLTAYQRAIIEKDPAQLVRATQAAALQGLVPERALLEISLPAKNNLQDEGYYRLLSNPGLMSLAAVLQFWQGAWNYPAIVRIFNLLIPDRSNLNGMGLKLGDINQADIPLYGQLRLGGEPDTLKRLIAAGFPVIIHKETQVPLADGKVDEYETVIGFDNLRKTFYFLDFSANAAMPQAVPYDRFDEEWRSFNFAFLVIYPTSLQRNYLKALGEDVDGIGN